MASPGTYVLSPAWLIGAVSPSAFVVFACLATFGTYDGDQYQECRPSVATLIERTKLSRSTVHRALGELIKAGAVTRERRFRPNGSKLPSCYRLAVEPPSLTPGTTPSVTRETSSELHSLTCETTPSVTSDTTHVSSAVHDLEPNTQIKPPAPSVRPAKQPVVVALFDAPVSGEIVETPNLTEAQEIIGGWLDRCRARPPSKIIARVGKIVKELLAEGVDPAWIKRGILLWMDKSLDPSTLHTFVNQAMNAGTGETAPTRAQQRHANNRSVVAMFKGVSTRDILPAFGPRRLTAGPANGGMA